MPGREPLHKEMAMVDLSRKVLSGICLCFVLSACAQPTVRDACENQWNLCLAGTEAASFLTEAEFISSCQDAANGENESGTVASEEEITCVADAATCAEIDLCVE